MHAIRSDHWQSQRLCNTDGNLITCLFFSLTMALEVDVYILWTKDANETFDNPSPGLFAAMRQCAS
jgi:hypothetical protein